MKKEVLDRYLISLAIIQASFDVEGYPDESKTIGEVAEHLKSLSETEEKLKRAYMFVMKNDISSIQQGLITRYFCNCCSAWDHTVNAIEHKPDCIVLEAQTWLEDKE